MTRIKIICNSDRHPKKTANIDTFTRFPDGTWGWLYAAKVTLLENDVIMHGDMRKQEIVQPEPGTPGGGVDWERMSTAAEAGTFRDRYRLECKLCGPKSGVTFRREEKLYRLLDRTAAALAPGESLSLSLLSQIVSRQD